MTLGAGKFLIEHALSADRPGSTAARLVGLHQTMWAMEVDLSVRLRSYLPSLRGGCAPPVRRVTQDELVVAGSKASGSAFFSALSNHPIAIPVSTRVSRTSRPTHAGVPASSTCRRALAVMIFLTDCCQTARYSCRGVSAFSSRTQTR